MISSTPGGAQTDILRFTMEILVILYFFFVWLLLVTLTIIMFLWRSVLKLKIIYFNDLTIPCRDQDEKIFHDKDVMQLGFETLQMKG